MTDLGHAAAPLLAAVFGWAGAAKLRSPRSTARSFEQLGLPIPGLLAVAVPAGELLLAAALLARPAIGAAASLGALAAFSAVLAAGMRRGVEVACGCFGAAGGRPSQGGDLVRNALLAVLAAPALWARAPAPPSLAAMISVTAAAAGGLVGLGLVHLRRDAGRLWDNTVEPGPGAQP